MAHSEAEYTCKHGATLPSPHAAACMASHSVFQPPHDPEGQRAERICILTGAEGENDDDCTTHEHETPRPLLDFDRRFDNECARAEEQRMTDGNAGLT